MIKTPPSVRVFVSYAREDREYCDQLLQHLGWLVNSGRLSAFNDRDIGPGIEWDAAIKEELNAANIIILIVTAHFMASKYCTTVELWAAMERYGASQSRVIPIVADHCDWTAMPVGRFQATPVDEQGHIKPLCDWHNRNRPFASIAQRVRELVDSMGLQTQPTSFDPREPIDNVAFDNQPANRPGAAVATLAHVPQLQRDPFLSLIDDLTQDFVGRSFVVAAIQAFFEAHDRGYFVIVGEPGIGKTAFAAHLIKAFGYIHHFADERSGMAGTRHLVKLVSKQLGMRYPSALDFDAATHVEDGAYLRMLLEGVSMTKTDKERIVIVVDGLDEAEQPVGGANVLELPAWLPRGSYFIVTTRPQGDLALSVDVPRQDFSIDPESFHNLNDVRHYIELVVQRGPLAERLRARQFTLDELTAKSEGNFMYLRHVLPELERGEITFDQLPQGLVSYYEWHWRRMKSRRADEWLTIQQPVICVLGTMREPLTVREIAELTGHLIGRAVAPEHVAMVLTAWQGFLRQNIQGADTVYRLYHRSFQEFLQKKAEVGDIDLRLAHQAIADAFLDKLKVWFKR